MSTISPRAPTATDSSLSAEALAAIWAPGVIVVPRGLGADLRPHEIVVEAVEHAGVDERLHPRDAATGGSRGLGTSAAGSAETDAESAHMCADSAWEAGQDQGVPLAAQATPSSNPWRQSAGNPGRRRSSSATKAQATLSALCRAWHRVSAKVVGSIW